MTQQVFAIVNASDADLNQSVSSVYLEFNNSEHASCTGVIVSENLILTAGHCFDSVDPKIKDIKISNNKHGTSKSKNIALAQAWARHPKYIEPKKGGRKEAVDIQYDIAFIKTKQNLLQTFGLTSEQLPKLFLNRDLVNVAINSNKQGMAYGYGMISLNDKSDESYKKQLPVTLEIQNEINVIISRSQLPNQGLCQGDSGGGLFMNYEGSQYLVGILSGISAQGRCGSEKAYGAYSLLTEKMCWILQASELPTPTDLKCSP